MPIQPVSVGIPTLPCEFGDYRLLKKLGSGGMGIVYEAEQISSGRRLALKVLNQSLDSTTAPSAAELAIADEADSAAVPHFQSLHPEHSGEINLAKGLPSTLFMVLTVLMLWQFVCILAVGSPLQMHLSGIAVVTEQ